MEFKSHGKAIELFFVNGSSDGVVTAELRNWSGKAIKIPRIEVGKYTKEELHYAGVYLLYCIDDDGNEKIYIGESEDVEARLKQHIADYSKGKEVYYWNHAVLFVDNRLDKAEIRYIENRLVNEIYDNNPKRLLTKSSYGNTNLKDSQIAVAEEFIDNLKTLLTALGNKLTDSAPKVENNVEYLYCKSKDANATGFISNNGFTVLKDSIIASTIANSFLTHNYYKLHQQLIEDGVIKNNKFINDYEFNAPSAASAVILGRASDGRRDWKTKTGKILKDILSKEV